MKTSILFGLVLALSAVNANADHNKPFPQSGNVSFGGIQVKVTVDPNKGYFQIGESKFYSTAKLTNGHLVMSGSQKVGIMNWDENLTATIFLNGGDGGNIEGYQEYKCEDVRITIVRVKSDGVRTVVKNECAYLE